MIKPMSAADRAIVIGARAPAFLVYCRTIGLGGSGPAVQARLCLQIGGRSAAECEKKLQEQLVKGDITEESYRIRAEAVSAIQDMFERGVQTHIDSCTAVGGWEPYGEGCHRRTVHHNH